MIRYLLDTNVLVHLCNEYQGWEKLAEKIENLGKDRLCVSVGTVFEVSRMAERAKMKKRVIEAVIELLSLLTVEPLKEPAAALAGSVHGWLMNRGVNVSDTDCLIAATAIHLECVLVTDDQKLFEIPGLKLENWIRS